MSSQCTEVGKQEERRTEDLAGVRGRTDGHVGTQMPMRTFTRTGEVTGRSWKSWV